MDLFNKRKVKELEERIKYLSNEIDGYMKNEKTIICECKILATI